MADWRDGEGHLDRASGVASPHDLAYLKANLRGGEGFDWYYASDADRASQTRAPITDGGGKPWVFRYKDIRSWWSNAHYDRPGGVEQSTATAWVPQSKPFWFLKIGCPAIDKGANQPNLFVDPKSVESGRPYFSNGASDDLAQRRLLQAIIQGFDPTHPDTPPAANPVSTLTGQHMVDLSRIHVYAWDARPYPAFPARRDIWKDADNWATGHWINGRAAAAPLSALVRAILTDYGFTRFEAAGLLGSAAGFVIERIMSAREALQTLELAFFFDVVESDGKLRFQSRAVQRPQATFAPASLVEVKSSAPLVTWTRAQETDLPRAAKVAFVAAGGDYERAVADAQRTTSASGRIASAALGVVLDTADGAAIADTWLYESWHARERAVFALPPSALALEPGDVVTIEGTAGNRSVRISEVGDHGARDIEALAFDATVYAGSPPRLRDGLAPKAEAAGPPVVTFLDIAPGNGIAAHLGMIAAAQDPWPGPVAVYSSPEPTGYALATTIRRSATTGLTTSTLAAGPAHRLDHANTLDVELDSGTLASVSPLALYAGGNTLAVEVASGIWEILQFQTATLIAPRRYRLSTLLRGRRGTDALIEPLVGTGARVVLLDDAVVPAEMEAASRGLPLYWQCGAARDPIGSASYVTSIQRFTGQGLRPFAPVHLRASRNSAGDLTIAWTRRSRGDADSWSDAEVPLGETSEAYRIEILSGPTVLRTIDVTAATTIYTAAQQIADFGATQATVAVRVAQLSSTFGPGHARTASL